MLLTQTGIAAILGAAVGFEREMAGKRAGIRTHMLTATAAAVAVGLGRLVVDPSAQGDPSRTLHAVITGVGFLGAGAILRSNEDGMSGMATGLTTAATVLCVAVLGAACALGAPLLAMITTALVLITLQALRMLEKVTDLLVARRVASGKLTPGRDDD